MGPTTDWPIVVFYVNNSNSWPCFGTKTLEARGDEVCLTWSFQNLIIKTLIIAIVFVPVVFYSLLWPFQPKLFIYS